MSRILAFSGSSRTGSVNRQLLEVAVQALERAGAAVTLIDLRDYPMPIYDGDLEAREGLPPNARKLKQLISRHQGLMIASPEHNAGVSALLKNALDWASRPADGQNGLVPFQNKVAALLAASPRNHGGVRGLPQLRAVLQNLGVLVLTEQFALQRAHEAFDADGGLIDPRARASVAGVAQRLTDVAAALAALQAR